MGMVLIVAGCSYLVRRLGKRSGRKRDFALVQAVEQRWLVERWTDYNRLLGSNRLEACRLTLSVVLCVLIDFSSALLCY